MTERKSFDAASAALDNAFSDARRGNLVAAQRTVDGLRSEVWIKTFPLLISRINLVEGLIFSYRGEWVKATDKFSRARIFSRIQRDESLDLLISAWMSLVDYNAGRLDDAASNAVSVLRNELSVAEARCRAASVLAVLFQLANNRASADRWFGIARSSNSRDGDYAESSVMIFNMSVTRFSCERFNRYFLPSNTRSLDLDLILNESSRNFDAASDVKILSHWHYSLKGRLLSLMERYDDAYLVFSAMMKLGEDVSTSLRSQVEIELLWCRLNLSSESLTASDIERIDEYIGHIHDDDDRAISLRIASWIYGKFGNRTKEIFSETEAVASAARFISWRTEFSERLLIMCKDL